MTGETKRHIAGWLNRFPEVMWDRLTEDAADVKAYGWVARDDGRFDFVLLDFWNADAGTPGFSTSSAELSATFASRLGVADENECQRVEHVLGDLVLKKIELPARAAL